VSFVLNDRVEARISPATRKRVLEAAAQLGYHPHAAARDLAGGRSHTIGLVLRQTPEQVAEDALLAETLRGVSAAARSGGFQVLVEPYRLHDGDYGDLIQSHRADGLIVSGPRVDDAVLLRLANQGVPVVIQGSLDEASVPSVDVDNVAAARKAVQHLLGLGHRRIGCLTNASLTYTAARERAAGYGDALRAAGVESDDALVVEADFNAASGRAAMARLLETDITAVFVASDVVALGAMAAIREAGRRMPDDISVVGFDDIPLAAYFDPPLTTVRLPAHDLGRAVGAALLDRIAGRPVAARTVLPTELVIRSSTAPPALSAHGGSRESSGGGSNGKGSNGNG
jgi:LacI family transcriptional regulator